uniref:Radical SAM protein n=1 Tax=Dictyoglomus thermophilum TaxID=14 RepID=A0A7C3MIG6_DICTH
MRPIYIESYKKGDLERKINILSKKLESCNLCPRNCKVNRKKREKGYCKASSEITISSYFPHFGEEKVLVGKSGSGTIFFTYCNLGCIFCQNYTISHLGIGEIIDTETLANIMIELQNMGCHNINLVTPTHYVPQILEALYYAIPKGLNIPLVYNSSGYESLETLRELEGIIDIYMPDIKFWSYDISLKLANAFDYPEVAKEAVKEMYRQVGNLITDENGVAIRGLIVRHLLLPNGVSSIKEWLEFLKREISTDVFINIMPQYRPLYKAYEYPLINRTILTSEYKEAINLAKNMGFTRIYID